MKASLIQTRALLVRPGRLPVTLVRLNDRRTGQNPQPRLMIVPPHASHRRRSMMPLRFIGDQPMGWQGISTAARLRRDRRKRESCRSSFSDGICTELDRKAAFRSSCWQVQQT